MGVVLAVTSAKKFTRLLDKEVKKYGSIN